MKINKFVTLTRLDRFEWDVLDAEIHCIEGKEIMEVKFVRNACSKLLADEAPNKNSVRS